MEEAHSMVSISEFLTEALEGEPVDPDDLYRALHEHQPWYVLRQRGVYALSEFDGVDYVQLSSSPTIPDENQTTGLSVDPIDLAEELHRLPEGCGIDLEPSTVGYTLFPDEVYEFSDAVWEERIFAVVNGTGGEVSDLIDHRFLVDVDERGLPVVEDAPGLYVIGASRGVFTPPLHDTESATRMLGRELLFRARELAGCEALWIGDVPLFIGVISDALADLHPRPNCRILPARSTAEIEVFLAQMHMGHERRIDEDGGILRYTGLVYLEGEITERTYSFRLTGDPTPDGELGAESSQILCAGALVEAFARTGSAPLAREALKLIPWLSDTVGNQSVRTADGSYHYSRYPEQFTNAWLTEAMTMANDQPQH